MTKNILTITGDINLETYKNCLRFIEKLNPTENLNERKNIILIINSFGGNVDCAFAIYDLLAMCDFDITTIAVGCCASMATILLSLGTKRYITANSTIVVHSTGYSAQNVRLTQAEAWEKLNDTKVDNQKIIKCYLDSNNFKMTQDELEEIFKSGRDYKMSASEAIEKGFATDILTGLEELM